MQNLGIMTFALTSLPNAIFSLPKAQNIYDVYKGNYMHCARFNSQWITTCLSLLTALTGYIVYQIKPHNTPSTLHFLSSHIFSYENSKDTIFYTPEKFSASISAQQDLTFAQEDICLISQLMKVSPTRTLSLIKVFKGSFVMQQF